VKILLTGRNGQVGWELERGLASIGEVFPFDHASLDLADPDQIVQRLRQVKPALIVNAAAYTSVDRAESEPALAMRVNGEAPGVLAEQAAHLGATLIHYSTDYVFDGTKSSSYGESDAPNPLNAYGRSKLAGEQAIQAVGCKHLILRTSWIYGSRGKNFLLTILRLAGERSELRVVDDQIGAPTWCRDIATATVRTAKELAAGSAPGGLYHLAARGATSWCEFAREILTLRGIHTPVNPISTETYPTPAKRPSNSVLSCAAISARWKIELPEWRKSLADCLRESDTLASTQR
jgi:dTDP-4-dehydrorhamnose reductase